MAALYRHVADLSRDSCVLDCESSQSIPIVPRIAGFFGGKGIRRRVGYVRMYLRWVSDAHIEISIRRSNLIESLLNL